MECKNLRKLPTKTIVGLLVFIVGCLLSSFRVIHDAPLRDLAPDDVAKLSDERFADLKAALPGFGTVGYIGELGKSSIPDYFLTQYALTPLVVDDSVNHKLVVGNFPTSLHPQLPVGLRLVKDFGNGVVLCMNDNAN